MSTYLQEAFKALDDVLNEEDFNLSSIDSFKDAKDFVEDDKIDFTDVIDPEAETEEELKDSYIGNVILDCCVCHSKIYKNPDEVEIDEDEGLANVSEECPFCYSTDGYTVVGMVAPYEKEKEEDEVEVEETTDEEEEIEEAYSKGQTVKFRGKPTKVLKVAKEDPDYVLIKDPTTGKKSWTNDIEESLEEEYKPHRLTADQIKNLKVGQVVYYDWNGTEKYEKVRVMKVGNRPVAGHIEVTIKAMQGDHEDQVVNADSLYTMLYESLKRRLKEAITTQDVLDNNGILKIDGFTITPGDHKSYYVYNIDQGIDREFQNLDRAVNFVNRQLNNSDKLNTYFKDKELYKVENVAIADSAVDAQKFWKSAFKLNFKVLPDGRFDNYETVTIIGTKDDLLKLISPNREEDLFDEEDIVPFNESLKNESFKRRRNHIKEHFEKVEIETDKEKMEMTTEEDGKVTVVTEPKDSEEEVIAPVSDEVQSEINPIDEPEESEEVEDIDVTEFSEEDFNDLGESYLKKVYENVDFFKTCSTKAAGNKLMIEGIIGFKSGKQKKTSFVFESKDINKSGKVRFIGENLQLSRGKKSFTMTGSIDNGRFIAESLNYNYRQKDSDGKSTRVYGTVRK